MAALDAGVRTFNYKINILPTKLFKRTKGLKLLSQITFKQNVWCITTFFQQDKPNDEIVIKQLKKNV